MNILKAVQVRWKRLNVNLSLWRFSKMINSQVAKPGRRTAFNDQHEDQPPVIFFNASTRLVGVSQNAAFSLLSAAGLQLAGIPVVYFSCRAGMSQCVLGTRLDNLSGKPPCKSCMAQSNWLFAHAPSVGFEYQENIELSEALSGLNIEQLSDFEHKGYPLGAKVLPSMRWVLRRHHLKDDAVTRKLFCEYIKSAFHTAQEFSKFLDQVGARAVIVFNGMFYPEAMARYVAQEREIPVITHEVGLRPFAAFFTYGQATAYPLDIPDDFQLSDEENNRLDQYLAQRFKGEFSMAGIKFWKGMSELGEGFEKRAEGYRQIVPVFTNVIFDTSQPHSNIVFDTMFEWLGLVVELARQNRDTLFVFRAHPDEGRVWKESRESVTEWVEDNKVGEEPNILFVGPEEVLSSYELIARSKFVMIYNSTIGLEASILGVPVLCAGKARFTQLPTVFFPKTIGEYSELAEKFLRADTVEAPVEFQRNARRFLFYQMFNSSLPFDPFLEEDGIWPGFVRLKKFEWEDLTSSKSAAVRAVLNGLTEKQDFILKRDEV